MIGATKEFICLSNEIGNKINSLSDDQMIDCGRVCFGIIGQLRRLGRGCQTKFMGVRYGHDHSIFNLPESRHRHFRSPPPPHGASLFSQFSTFRCDKPWFRVVVPLSTIWPQTKFWFRGEASLYVSYSARKIWVRILYDDKINLPIPGQKPNTNFLWRLDCIQ